MATKRTWRIPRQLVFQGFVTAINIHDPATKRDRSVSFKNHILTADVNGKTLFLLPNTAGKGIPSASESKTEKGRKLYSRWGGTKKGLSFSVAIPDKGEFKFEGLCLDIFYTSDKHGSGTSGYVDYVHTFKALPYVTRMQRSEVYRISMVNVTARGIEDNASAMKGYRKAVQERTSMKIKKHNPVIPSTKRTARINPKKAQDPELWYERIRDAVKKITPIETLRDVARNGAEGGYPSWTYYEQTVRFYEAHKEDIFRMLSSMSEDSGVTVIELLSLSRSSSQINDYDTFANLLAWWALEYVAQRETEQEE